MCRRDVILTILALAALPAVGFALGWFLMETGIGGFLLAALAIGLMWRSPAAIFGAFLATVHWFRRR